MPGPVQSVERAAAILKLLAASSAPLALVEVANSLDLAKGTAHGLLRTLVEVGFVEQDRTSGRYALGATLLQLGTDYLDVNELRSRALNWADPLASRTGEAVRVGVLHGAEVLVVHHVFRPDDTAQTVEAGALLPAHATALGKVLLAHDPAAVARLGAPLASFTHRTLTDSRALAASLAEVRRRDWAVSVEELEVGRAAIAAPIRGRGGLVVGAVGISGDCDRLAPRGTPPAGLLSLVADTARAISHELGARAHG
ncbi:DNA-binding IclR family transcriptional regulator [Motilibacter peucedani]|uniref:Glycerol operon regulatory protein n=1 Tax=Motilibacter peucedani TaxID=598650 RepID=A0A420XR69_9ACTN|nr:IclR family transcriptional regulator [Motilibacter peucedani]RKS75706.1 DNA-binding IclR family transcriptional regulator [Motilibacter peucedani]